VIIFFFFLSNFLGLTSLSTKFKDTKEELNLSGKIGLSGLSKSTKSDSKSNLRNSVPSLSISREDLGSNNDSNNENASRGQEETAINVESRSHGIKIFIFYN
jgi:hypothetical protein